MSNRGRGYVNSPIMAARRSAMSRGVVSTRARGGPPMYGFARGGMRPAYASRGQEMAFRAGKRPIKMRPRPTRGRSGTAKPLSMGRGCTVESAGDEAAVVSVSQPPSSPEDLHENVSDFTDADELPTTNGLPKSMLDSDIRSPDSGILGDNSAGDLNITA